MSDKPLIVFYRYGDDQLLRVVENWREIPEPDIHPNFLNDALTVLDGSRASDGFLWIRISGIPLDSGWVQDNTITEISYATWLAQKATEAAAAKEENTAARIEAQEARQEAREALSASISEKLDALGLSAEEIAYITTGAI